MAALNTTFTKDDLNTSDPTKTLVLSKNRVRPNLPEARGVNDENIEHGVDSARERHHVRRSTVTVNDSAAASEIAQIINEVTDSNPDDLVLAIQRRLAGFLSSKESNWKQEIDKAVKKSSASYEIKLAQLKTQQARTPMATTPGRAVSPDYSSLDQVVQERDNYREQAILSMKTVSDLIDQQKKFMEKEKQYHDMVANFRKEQQEAVETITQLHERFRSLQQEAESRIEEANEEIERIHKQHNDDTIALRFKYRQQEMQIKSLEGQLENLNAEKKELLQMCEDLIARNERIKAENPIAVEE